MIKKATAINLIKSLVEVGGFIGLPQKSRDTLSQAISELRQQGVDLDDELKSLDSLIEFDSDIKNFKSVVFDIVIEKEKMLNINDIVVLGPISNIRKFLSKDKTTNERNDLKYELNSSGERRNFSDNKTIVFTLICEIDFESIKIIEDNQDVFESIDTQINIFSKTPIKIARKYYV